MYRSRQKIVGRVHINYCPTKIHLVIRGQKLRLYEDEIFVFLQATVDILLIESGQHF